MRHLATASLALAVSPAFAACIDSLHQLDSNGTVTVAVGLDGLVISDASGDWQRYSTPTNRDFNRVQFVNGLFWALGKNGVAISSQDGRAWGTRDVGVSAPLRAIEWANGTYVIGGDDTLLYSGNGNEWSAASVPDLGGAVNILDIAHVDGQFVALANGDTILTSANGRTWSEANDAPGASGLSDLAFDGTTLAASGSSDSVQTTPSGLDGWGGSVVDVPASCASDIAFPDVDANNGFFVAGSCINDQGDRDGIFASSGTGVNWTAADFVLEGQPIDTAFVRELQGTAAASRFIAVSNGQLVSQDGVIKPCSLDVGEPPSDSSGSSGGGGGALPWFLLPLAVLWRLTRRQR